MTHKARPKKTNPHSKPLNKAERKRNRDWIINKDNSSAELKKPSPIDTRARRSSLRRFSGVRGK